MENKRNAGVDVVRALSVLLIILYHSWVQCGAHAFRSSVFTTFVSLGGEIGVTAFFLLSGYGIYCSLAHADAAGTFSWKSYLRRRAMRILPPYYLCLLVTLLFTDGASYLSAAHVGNVR